jgi:hypothetical protein
MSETTVVGHTPGPWREVVNCQDYEAFPTLVYAGSQMIAQIATDQLVEGSADEANARLIAAAPELYAALLEYVERHEASGTDPNGLPEYDAARAAIQKAEGRHA